MAIHENKLMIFFTSSMKRLENKIERLSNENTLLNQEVESLKTSADFQNKWFEEAKKDLEEMRAKDPIEEDIKLIEQKHQQLGEKKFELEDRSRRNNLRFRGFTEKAEGTKTCEESENLIREFIEGNLEMGSKYITIERAHRISFKINGKKRAIIVKFLNYKDKHSVLNQYRQKQLWKVNMDVNEDYSERRAELRKQLCSNKQKRFDNRESLQKLCIRNLWYQGSTTQHKFQFSLIDFQILSFFCIKNKFISKWLLKPKILKISLLIFMKLVFTNFDERDPNTNFLGDITKSSFETCFQYKMRLRNSVQTPNYKIIRIFLSRDSILFLTKGVKRVGEAEF